MKPSKFLPMVLRGATACLLLVSYASAQRDGQGSGVDSLSVVERYQLASLADVQMELKLSDSQKKAVTDAVAKLQESQQRLSQLQVAPSRPRAGGRPDAADALKIAKEFAAASKERSELLTKIKTMGLEQSDKLVAMLNEEQKSRLTGLYAQANRATFIFADPAIIKALGITGDQKKKFVEINSNNVKLMMSGMQSRQGSIQDAQGATAKIWSEADAAHMKLLTDEQKKKLEALKGKELTMDLRSLRAANGDPGNK